MNTQPKISRREIRELIRKLIAKATDPTKCLEAYDWTFTPSEYGGIWVKSFNFPYYLLTSNKTNVHLVKNLIVKLEIDTWGPVSLQFLINSKSSHQAVYSSRCETFNCFTFNELKVRYKMCCMLQQLAINLPKTIDSIRMKSFDGKKNRQQIKIIWDLKLKHEINRVFVEAYKTADLRYSYY